MTDTLPSNFHQKLTILQNYSKQPIRVLPVTGASVTANGFTTFQLPVGCVLDLRTICLHFFGQTTTATFTDLTAANIVGFPQHTACLIQNLSININGTNVQNIPYYGWLYKLLTDFKTNYNARLKQIGTNPDPSLYLDMTDAGIVTKYPTYTNTASTNVNSFKRNYEINDWIGLLSSCEPSIWDTNLMGQIEIVIQWAPVDVLWSNPQIACNYKLDDIELYVDKIDFKDDRYFMIQEQLLAGTNGLSIPFKNYMVYLGTDLTNNKTTTVKCTENCRSLDKIIYSMMNGTRNTNSALQLGTQTNILADVAVGGNDAATIVNLRTFTNDNVQEGWLAPRNFCYANLIANGDPNLLNSSVYFKRNGLGLGVSTGTKANNNTIEFFINSQSVCQLSLLKAYQETMKAFELNDDQDRLLINPGLQDLVRFEKDFFAVALSTSHINNKNEDLGYLVSGRNTQATSVNLAVSSISQRAADNAQAATPCVVTEFSSMIIVRPQRNIGFIR